MPLDSASFVYSQVVQLLKEGARQIALSKRWCRGSYTNKNGQRCALGAIGVGNRTIDSPEQAKAIEFLNDVAQRRGYRTIVRLNDATSHAIVLEAYREAIADARVAFGC